MRDMGRSTDICGGASLYSQRKENVALIWMYPYHATTSEAEIKREPADVTIFIQINPKTTNNVQIPSSSLILDDSNHPNILKPHKNPHPTKSRV
jgi:hypothetical protein